MLHARRQRACCSSAGHICIFVATEAGKPAYIDRLTSVLITWGATPLPADVSVRFVLSAHGLSQLFNLSSQTRRIASTRARAATLLAKAMPFPPHVPRLTAALRNEQLVVLDDSTRDLFKLGRDGAARRFEWVAHAVRERFADTCDWIAMTEVCMTPPACESPHAQLLNHPFIGPRPPGLTVPRLSLSPALPIIPPFPACPRPPYPRTTLTSTCMRPVGRSTARWLRRGTGCTGTAARSLVTHGETLCTAIGWSSTAAPSYGPTTRSGSARCRAFLGAIDFSAASFGTPRAGPATRKSGGIPATMQARGRDTRPPPRSAGRGVCSARPLRGSAPFLLCRHAGDAAQAVARAHHRRQAPFGGRGSGAAAPRCAAREEARQLQPRREEGKRTRRQDAKSSAPRPARDELPQVSLDFPAVRRPLAEPVLESCLTHTLEPRSLPG